MCVAAKYYPEALLHNTTAQDIREQPLNVTVVRGSSAKVDGGCGVGTKVVAARGGEWCGGSSRSGEGECFWFWPESSPKKFFGGGGGGQRVVEVAPVGMEEGGSVCVAFLYK
nr:hypothetical protein [Tanacetum cinerariifolium]